MAGLTVGWYQRKNNLDSFDNILKPCPLSINQISMVPISLAKPGSVARQQNQCSIAKINETVPWHQQAVGCAGV